MFIIISPVNIIICLESTCVCVCASQEEDGRMAPAESWPVERPSEAISRHAPMKNVTHISIDQYMNGVSSNLICGKEERVCPLTPFRAYIH